jgi:hypothetical protein
LRPSGESTTSLSRYLHSSRVECYGSFTGTSTIYRSHLRHAPTAPHRSQSVSRPLSSNDALRRQAAHAPRASVTACASDAQRQHTRCFAPRRIRRACLSLFLQGSTHGWRSMHSRSVPRDCSLGTSSRVASALAQAGVVEMVVRVRGRIGIGTYIARLRTSEWKSGQREVGASSILPHFRSPSLRLTPDWHRLMYALSPSRLQGAEPDRATWQAAYKCFRQAFVEPPDAPWQKKLAKVLKRPPPKEVADALFTYNGFLHGLGRMSLSA